MNPPLPAAGASAASAALRRSALDDIAALVERQRSGDEVYFRGQRTRYARGAQRLQEIAPAPCRVLDIGSHYLHQAALLSRLGYEVTGIDVDLFASAPFVRERAAAFGVRNLAVNGLEAGEFLPGEEGRFGLIVFTEIIEHITFNPVRLWRRVHALLQPGGVVYVSTPNSMRPAAWVRAARDLLAFRGRGIGLEEIMGTVTYGHHWKEYSATELRRYFALLSSDFEVRTRWYSSDLAAPAGVKGRIKSALARVPCWRSDIEAVVRKTGQAGFGAAVPFLRMQAAAQLADAARAPAPVPTPRPAPAQREVTP